MLGSVKILLFLNIISIACASYSGPFLLWGIEKLKDIKLPALEAIDERTLTNLYTEAKAVVIFLRNSTSRLDKEYFHNFKELISNSHWAYLPQNNLQADPVDYNSNLEIITLVGPIEQQDIELSALYRDAVTIYGEVLGILANQADDVHFVYKRDADETLDSISNPSDEPMQANYIYIDRFQKGLLYTSSAPLLVLDSGNITRELKEHGLVTFDVRNRNQSSYSRLIISFIIVEGKITVRFRFPSFGGYWSLNDVEIQTTDYSIVLPIVGDPPTVPFGFSYTCSRPLVFRNGSNSLTLSDIQVQPKISAPHFSDAYNCVGFTTAPIWSGIFVSAILVFGTFIGILALMDIKTPNRFESNRSKQLTFTVQE